MSEVVRRSGVPLPTIKYYLREGLLMPGTSLGATQTEYGDEHLQRIATIKALSDVAGLPIQRVKNILDLIDRPGEDLFETLGQAVGALPPYVETNPEQHYPRAQVVMDSTGQDWDPDYVAVAQLERALTAAANAGLELSPERLEAYWQHILAIAAFDLSRTPAEPTEAVQYGVLGTALYEPIVLALRRLAHKHVGSQLLKGPRPGQVAAGQAGHDAEAVDGPAA